MTPTTEYNLRRQQSTILSSVSYPKKDLRGPAQQSFFRYDNDKDLKVCFLVTCVIWLTAYIVWGLCCVHCSHTADLLMMVMLYTHSTALDQIIYKRTFKFGTFSRKEQEESILSIVQCKLCLAKTGLKLRSLSLSYQKKARLAASQSSLLLACHWL